MRKIPVVAVLAMATAMPTLAQTHQHTQEPVIDGKVNPELIPDAVAYRLYFASISPSDKDTDTDMKRRTARIKMLGLQSSDEAFLVSAMTDFGTAYRGLITDYNVAANAAWKSNPQNVDPTIKQKFILVRDQLVQLSIGNLQANLSANGWLQLATMVKAEKANMKIQGPAQ